MRALECNVRKTLHSIHEQLFSDELKVFNRCVYMGREEPVNAG